MPASTGRFWGLTSRKRNTWRTLVIKTPMPTGLVDYASFFLLGARVPFFYLCLWTFLWVAVHLLGVSYGTKPRRRWVMFFGFHA